MIASNALKCSKVRAAASGCQWHLSSRTFNSGAGKARNRADLNSTLLSPQVEPLPHRELVQCSSHTPQRSTTHYMHSVKTSNCEGLETRRTEKKNLRG